MCGTCQILDICIEVFFPFQTGLHSCTKRKERKNVLQCDTSNWPSEIVGINCMHESCMREFQFPFHFFFWPPIPHAWPVIFLFAQYTVGLMGRVGGGIQRGVTTELPTPLSCCPLAQYLLLLQGGCLCILTMNLSTIVRL